MDTEKPIWKVGERFPFFILLLAIKIVITPGLSVDPAKNSGLESFGLI